MDTEGVSMGSYKVPGVVWQGFSTMALRDAYGNPSYHLSGLWEALLWGRLRVRTLQGLVLHATITLL